MKARWLAMMLGTGFLGATALGGAVVGCSGGGGSQREFDFTSSSDRAQWQTEGLAYQGSVGPYAVFKVTAAKQRLVGPSVTFRGGVVALAGAQNYFIASKTAAAAARMSLRAGEVALLDVLQTPMSDGQCSPGTTTTGGGGDLGSGGGGGGGGGASGDMSGWGNPCNPPDMGGGGGGGSGGYGGGGSGGYGGGGSGGYGGGGSGGYGGGGSGGSGGGYGNPGGLPGGGWNNPGCPTDMGGGGSGGNGGGGSGGNGGGGSGGNGGGGSGGNGGGGSGGNGGGDSSDSDLGPPPAPIYIDFPSPAPVGATILIQRVTLGGSAPPNDTPPPICCTDGTCTTGGGGSGGAGGGGGSGNTGGGPIQ